MDNETAGVSLTTNRFRIPSYPSPCSGQRQAAAYTVGMDTIIPCSVPGKLRPPYPVEHCASSDCGRVLTETPGAYLYRDLDTDKLVVFCDDCARFVELNQRMRFMLIAL